eukprot:GHVS01073313.1.p1 GENE.GHVS01073313.1~~GHVS01073313.1.p1  ORF type:complete len:275 (-),score=38.30 GHVS01073313.1:1109-1933(-)
MAAYDHNVIGSPLAPPGAPLDPGRGFVHVDVEMAGRMGSDALRFCDICCPCCERRGRCCWCPRRRGGQLPLSSSDYPSSYVSNITRTCDHQHKENNPFHFHPTGVIQISDPEVLVDAVRRVNSAYHCALPLVFTSANVIFMGTVIPFVGVCCVIGGIIYGAAAKVAVERVVALWVGLALIVVGCLWHLLYCWLAGKWTMQVPFNAIHEECEIVNQELKRDNIRFDFLLFDNIQYILAIRGRHRYSSKFYNTYLLRITDYKQPIQPLHHPPSSYS